MAGVVPGAARMTDRLTLGYRSGVTNGASPSGRPGRRCAGHEFHYSTVDPAGDAIAMSSRFGAGAAGFATPTLLASFLHHHPGGDPSAVAGFLAACRGRPTVTSASEVDALLGPDAGLVGVLDVAHLGDGVGDLDQRRRRVAAGADDVDVGGRSDDGGEHVVERRSSPS